MKKTDLTDTFRSRGIHRRNFIKTVGVGAAGAAMIGSRVSPLSPITAQAQTSPTLSKYTEQLPVPAVVNAKGGGTFTLPMAPGLQRFHSVLPSHADMGLWRYAIPRAQPSKSGEAFRSSSAHATTLAPIRSPLRLTQPCTARSRLIRPLRAQPFTRTEATSKPAAMATRNQHFFLAEGLTITMSTIRKQRLSGITITPSASHV